MKENIRGWTFKGRKCIKTQSRERATAFICESLLKKLGEERRKGTQPSTAGMERQRKTEATHGLWEESDALLDSFLRHGHTLVSLTNTEIEMKEQL